MNRRSFFKSMVGGIATAAAVRTFPFRVLSFPSTPLLITMKDIEEFSKMYMEPAIRSIGYTITIPTPARFVVKQPHLILDREALTVESWDAQSGTMRLRIPGRSQHPFTGIVTG